MHEQYNTLADQLNLSCAACTENCCTSYFQHHTYIEWAYLWHGIQSCSKEKQDLFFQKAKKYLREMEILLAQGKTPNLMCPLNTDGWCELYGCRLMICRLHGVPNQVRMPNGSIKRFPGCKPCQRIISHMEDFPVLDRTPLYLELAKLERRFLAKKSANLPKLNLTIAEMLLKGPPPVL